MPIQFPQPKIGPCFASVTMLATKPFYVVPAPVPAASRQARQRHRNLRNLGKPYQSVVSHSIVNPVGKPLNDKRIFFRVLGRLSHVLTGVTMTGAGVPLGGVTIQVFRTEDETLVGETVSDGSGNFTCFLIMTAGGPFFLNGYLPGSPDLAGTTRNNIVISDSMSIYMRDPTVADAPGGGGGGPAGTFKLVLSTSRLSRRGIVYGLPVRKVISDPSPLARFNYIRSSNRRR